MPIDRIKWLKLELGRLLRFLDSNLRMHEQAQATESVDRAEMSLETSLYGPQTDIQVACRAVYYELASILEHEIQVVAYRVAIPRHDPDSPILHGDPESTVGVNYKRCVNQIELALQVKLSELPGAKTVSTLREVVNSFKHRKGLVERNPSSSGMRIPHRHNISGEEAGNAVEDTQRFLLALHEASGFRGKISSNNGVEQT